MIRRRRIRNNKKDKRFLMLNEETVSWMSIELETPRTRKEPFSLKSFNKSVK